MISLIGRRILQLAPTLVILSIFIFMLQRLLPGDPALALAGDDQDPVVIEQIRKQYNLDKPIPVQYVLWVAELSRGDLGQSMRFNAPVARLVSERLPVTLQLATMAMAVALLIGLTAGILSAVLRGGTVDYGISIMALAGISVPNFWLGIMLILLLSVHLGWLPPSGYVGLFEDWRRSLSTTIMPAFVLGSGIAGVMMRHMRSAMIEALESDYIRTARAKGLSEPVVVLKHALRNALTPIITLGALEFGSLLSGAILTEQVFSIPGIGKLVVDAVFNRDYAVVQGIVLVTAVIYVMLNLLADIGYILANPRLRD